jgi:acyl-CoA oxidase
MTADRRARRGRELPAQLLPLAPSLYLVWSDGTLTGDEIRALRERATRRGLPDADAAALRVWLDPDDPPTATELDHLLERIRAGAGPPDQPDGPGDLVRLGERIASGAAGSRRDDVLSALADLQDALGVAPREAARSLVGGAAAATGAHDRASFDPSAMHAFLDGDSAVVRRRVFDMLAGPGFARPLEEDTAAYRARVLQWCRILADAGFGAMAYPAEFGGADDVAGSIAAFETIAYHDLSLLVKYGVQFGLFGGAILQLGTRSHHERWLADIGALRLPGCFAMTETDHGSNVRDIGTTAVYDVAAESFVIHTPHPGARKDYIGNAALHGRMAVVFAQLVTPTGTHGVHAFVVPIRDEEGRPLPGISLEDCGPKGGLNGVDNGRIAFSRVRVPRDHLLDRYGSVSAGGAYSSPIPGATRRFFTMLGTLVAGRISIACASLSAAKSGLATAIRHTDRRRQFGPESAPEMPLLDYTTMQLRLLPRLATAYALDAALAGLVARYAGTDTGNDDVKEIEARAAALKAYASDWAVASLQECREACGGHGYLAENRITAMRADSDVFTTFEGANHVLYQLVARARLSEYRDQFGELKLWGVARHIAGRAATRVTERNPIATRRTDADHLLDLEFHAAALRYRDERLLGSLARRLKHRLDRGMDSFDALNECQDHAVVLGRAVAERLVLEGLHARIDACDDDALRPVLESLAALFALDRLRQHAGWFIEAGYIEPPKARAIRAQVNDLCRRLRPDAIALTDAFGIPDALLDAPIARRETA